MWTEETYLLASIHDSLQDANWLTVAKSVGKGKTPKRPTPIDRPADVREKHARAARAADKARIMMQLVPPPVSGSAD